MKKRKRIILSALFLLTLSVTSAQDARPPVTLKPRFPGKVLIAPAALFSLSLLAATDNEVFDNWETREERNEMFARFRTHVDDYLQFTPIVAVIGMDAAGAHNHKAVGQLAVRLAQSEFLMVAMVWPLKKIVAEPRPDTGVPGSFPSGHTAEAFLAATIFQKEYGNVCPLGTLLAYGTATGIGALRVLNDRHWLSDVFAGAGLGILAGNLVYLEHRMSVKSRTPLTLMPVYNRGAWGARIGFRL